MEQSILTSTKKILHIGEDDESFDLDVITHINTAFSTLNGLGVGDEAGFEIEDASAEWGDYLTGNIPQLNRVKTFVWLHSRILFDPPITSFQLEAYKNQLDEQLWRISENRESTDWVDPDPPEVDEEDILDLDGGGSE